MENHRNMILTHRFGVFFTCVLITAIYKTHKFVDQKSNKYQYFLSKTYVF